MSTSQPSESEPGFHTISPDHARELMDELSSPETFADLAEAFAVLSDPTRLRIVSLLHRRELCVHDLAALLDKTPSAVSHQLRELRNKDVVKRRRDGRVVYYSLADEQVMPLIERMLQTMRPGSPP